MNRSDVQVVCVQHEFGIFGGSVGRDLESFLDAVDAPVVTTLHTVLADPVALGRTISRLLARPDEVAPIHDAPQRMASAWRGPPRPMPSRTRSPK